MPSTGKKGRPLLTAQSIVVRFEPAEIKPSASQVARYLGGSRYKMDADISARINVAVDRGLHLIKPQMVYALHAVTETAGNRKLKLAHGLSLHISPEEVDPQVKYISAVICTLGPDLEKNCNQLRGENKLLEAMVLDATGVAMLEMLAEKAYKILSELAGKHRLYMGCRLEPGIGDMDLSIQSALFMLVKGEKIKVHLNNSRVMTPHKSVSFFVGLTRSKNARRHLYKCRTCRKKDCQFRINPGPV